MDLSVLSSNEEDDGYSPSEGSDIDEESHTKLLNLISSLDGKKKKKVQQRTESSQKVDEFNLTEAQGAKLSFADLVSGLKKKDKYVKLKKELKRASNTRVLPPPLSKPETERAQRSVVYKKASDEVDKWNNIVHKNRVADQIIYPLKRVNLSIQTVEEVTKRFKLKTPLELEVSELLQDSKNVLTKEKELTAAEEEALKAMSLEEAIERRNELRKMRALQSYQETKARRQNKIKSKKYHRLLKKDRMKKQLKEFEELKKANPEMALEELEEIEKSRIGERMSLKHRNTGKWAKRNVLRAKYDMNAREALREQVEINKKLVVKKRTRPESEEEEEDELLLDLERKNEEEAEETVPIIENSSNPWMSSKSKANRPMLMAIKDVENQEIVDDSEEEQISETLQRKKTYEEFSNSLELPEETKPKKRKVIRDVPQSKPEPEIDPTNFMSVEAKQLPSHTPDLSGVGEEVFENEDDQHMNIAEAFADDDVIEEFKMEKQAMIEENKPRDIDLTLPGWGSWGGSGIKISARKRKRFTLKPKPGPQRKDHTLGNVIINEKESEKASKHQVSELPHPFNSTQQFQNSIRMPIGRNWNPETAFEQLVKPKIVTKLGAVIEPIHADALLEDQAKEEKVNKQKKSSTKGRKKPRKKSK